MFAKMNITVLLIMQNFRNKNLDCDIAVVNITACLGQLRFSPMFL